MQINMRHIIMSNGSLKFATGKHEVPNRQETHKKYIHTCTWATTIIIRKYPIVI